MSIPKHLETTRAVFQGGGIKAISLLGAADEAIKNGMIFSALAGTSAGSIIAAFLGAGAKPNSIIETIKHAELNNFLAKPEVFNWQTCKSARFFGKIANAKNGAWNNIVSYYLHGGSYSSRHIEEWIDKNLSILIPSAERPIKFKDLVKPTKIIAADLSSGDIKVWGTDRTPDDHVGFAVRASCSIPFFYQPVVSGKGAYVDGGMLSNLPAFVFKDDEDSSQDPIIKFVMKEQTIPPDCWTPRDFLDRIYTTIIDGSTKLQEKIGGNAYSIIADVTGYETTDFSILDDESRLHQLDKIGRDAFNEFISNYSAQAINPDYYRQNPDVFIDESEAYSWFVSESEQTTTSMIIGASDTRWFWSLFPTVLNTLIRKIKIVALLTPQQGDCDNLKEESQRRDIMSNLGIKIKEQQQLPFNGFYLFDENSKNNRALIKRQGSGDFEFYAKAYSGKTDRAILHILGEQLKHYLNFEDKECPIISSAEPEYFINALKTGVPQYHSNNCSINIKTVLVEDLLVLNKYIRASKYKQIEYLYAAFKSVNLVPFEPAMISMHNHTVSYITPPVIEKIGSKYVVIEGNTRIYYAWRTNIKKITCLIVEGTEASLPGRPDKPELCIVDSKKRQGRQRIRDFNETNFRPIERAIRPLPGN